MLPGPPEPGKAAASNGKPRQAVESRDDSRPASNASFAPREEQLKPEDPEDPEVPEDPAIEGPEDPGGPDWFDELEFPVTLNTIEARNAVLEFVRYRETKGKPMPELSVQKALRRFARDRWPSRKLIEAIEHSIAQGYDGIVEPKGEGIGPSATRQTNQERVAEHNRTILEKYRSGARGNEPLTVDGEVMEAKEKLQ